MVLSGDAHCSMVLELQYPTNKVMVMYWKMSTATSGCVYSNCNIPDVSEVSLQFTDNFSGNGAFQLFDAYLHGGEQIGQSLYAVGITQFNWINYAGNESTTFYSREKNIMYAFVSHQSKDHVNCDDTNTEEWFT